MKNNLFTVILTYTVPIEVIDAHRPKHVEFLDEYYAKGMFIASGPQVPRTGGIIIATAESKEYLEKILKEDPFYTNNLAEYKVIEFMPLKHAECINKFVN